MDEVLARSKGIAAAIRSGGDVARRARGQDFTQDLPDGVVLVAVGSPSGAVSDAERGLAIGASDGSDWMAAQPGLVGRRVGDIEHRSCVQLSQFVGVGAEWKKCDVVEVPAVAEAQHGLEVLQEVLHDVVPALRENSREAMPQSAWRDIEVRSEAGARRGHVVLQQSAWHDLVVKGAPQNLCDISFEALRDAGTAAVALSVEERFASEGEARLAAEQAGPRLNAIESEFQGLVSLRFLCAQLTDTIQGVLQDRAR